MRPFARVFIFVSVVILSSASTFACPLRFATGREVREAIFNSEFAYNVLTTLLPFPLLGGSWC